jgi:hypothetical protein
MGKHFVFSFLVAVFIGQAALPEFANAQDKATADIMGFIQQMTGKTKACEASGISEQQCVCQSKGEWQDMLVLMQLMQNDPNVDAANRSVLSQGVAKVQGMLGNCP